MKRSIYSPVSFIAAALLAFMVSGCAGMHVTKKVERFAAGGDYQSALATIEAGKNAYKGANSLLYFMDRGALLQRVEAYKDSSEDLAQAELLMEEFASTSVSQAAASFLVNDMTMDYSGEDFEQVMVNVINALNYLYRGDMQGAGVEARKVNTRLVQIIDKYKGKAVYDEDAFARYLAAFIHESLGDYNSAYIDYKKAYQGFLKYRKRFGMPVPDLIKDDLIRLSRWMGFYDDYGKWRKTFGTDRVVPSKRPKKRSEVLFVIYDGMIPTKRTKYVVSPITTPDGRPYALKVAFPDFIPKEPVVGSVRVGTPDGKIYESAVMEPLNFIAYKTLAQRIGLISAKAIARATAKYIAAYQVRQATKTKDEGVNMLVGLATNVFTYATEQADTRSWRTLPNRFHIVRVPLKPGEHQLEIRVESITGGTRQGYPVTVKLEKGEKKVLPVYLPQ